MQTNPGWQSAVVLQGPPEPMGGRQIPETPFRSEGYSKHIKPGLHWLVDVHRSPSFLLPPPPPLAASALVDSPSEASARVVRPKPNFFTAARRVTDKAMALASSSNWFGFMISPFSCAGVPRPRCCCSCCLFSFSLCFGDRRFLASHRKLTSLLKGTRPSGQCAGADRPWERVEPFIY
jgi:hypothetical protein